MSHHGSAAPNGNLTKLLVEGMDCAACALKIETALSRLPGATDIAVNYGTKTLSLRLDEDRTPLKAVEARIRALGYMPTPVGGAAAQAAEGDHHEQQAGPWWRTSKAVLALGIGLLLALAFIASILMPGAARWAYLTVAIIAVVPFARRALTSAVAGLLFTIEMLMSVAAIGAIAIGASEEAAVVSFLFALGELLEDVAAGRARAGIEALIGLVPRVALLEDAGQLREVPAERLAVGDIVLVRPGDRVPSDGEVIDGQSEVDEAPVTGESVPVLKAPGAAVFAGSINVTGSVRVRIARTAKDNTIARIIHLVEEAQGTKAPTARFIDRFSLVYTPIAMVLAALVIVVPPLLFGADWDTWIYRGLATLLVACPCALVISTPAAIASGLAAGARRGLLIKGGAALETLGKVATVAFDKTGTLTMGSPKVTDTVGELDEPIESILSNAAAVEQGSNHPLGRAIVAEAKARGLSIPQIFGGTTASPGKGVTARLRDGFVSVGSPRHAREVATLSGKLDTAIATLEAEGKTVVVVLYGEKVAGLIALRDEPREDSREGILRLRNLGISPIMLTGDNARTGNAIGKALGIDVKADLLPADKLAQIEGFKRQSPVAMVGDGINDAPALAAASVGIAMGGGTEVALETADAALLKNRVVGVADLIELSRATMTNIWQNITIALGLKAVFLTTTLLGTTPLWMAILSDTGATVLVTANALRLLGVRADRRHSYWRRS